MFLYNLLQGSTKVVMISSGSYEYSRENYGRNDGHRFAQLAVQLYSDKNQRSLLSSIANVLARNRHVCPRVPKFKDTRKARQSPVFNGWTDEQEPKSPLADLFSRLVPALQSLKRQRGALRFPPLPPYPEFPVLPDSCPAPAVESCRVVQLSDTNCTRVQVHPVDADDVIELARRVHFDLGGEANAAPKPIAVDDVEAFDQLAAAAADANQLFVVKFEATWCAACVQVRILHNGLKKRAISPVQSGVSVF
jgi:hypothetical protein